MFPQNLAFLAFLAFLALFFSSKWVGADLGRAAGVERPVLPRAPVRVACALQSHRSLSDVTLAGSGVVSMLGRFEPTQAGFILEGEVCETATGGPCSVSGAVLDEERQPAPRSLLEVLREFEGRKVRITLEVMDPQPIDTLRELLEYFRRESEATADDYPMVG